MATFKPKLILHSLLFVALTIAVQACGLNENVERTNDNVEKTNEIAVSVNETNRLVLEQMKLLHETTEKLAARVEKLDIQLSKMVDFIEPLNQLMGKVQNFTSDPRFDEMLETMLDGENGVRASLVNANQFFGKINNCAIPVFKQTFLSPAEDPAPSAERIVYGAKVGELQTIELDSAVVYYIVPDVIFENVRVAHKKLIPRPGSFCEAVFSTSGENLMKVVEFMLSAAGKTLTTLVGDNDSQGDGMTSNNSGNPSGVQASKNPRVAAIPMPAAITSMNSSVAIVYLEDKLSDDWFSFSSQFKSLVKNWKSNPNVQSLEVSKSKFRIPGVLYASIFEGFKREGTLEALDGLTGPLGRVAFAGKTGEDLRGLLKDHMEAVINEKVDFPVPFLVAEVTEGELSVFEDILKLLYRVETTEEEIEVKDFLIDTFYFLYDRQLTRLLIQKTLEKKSP